MMKLCLRGLLSATVLAGCAGTSDPTPDGLPDGDSADLTPTGDDTASPDDTAAGDDGDGGGEDGGGDGGTTGGDSGGDPEPACEGSWVRHDVASPAGPAYAEPADLDGDGVLELIIASFGTFNGFTLEAGTVQVHRHNGDLSSWSASDIVPESAGIEFPNQPTATDMDGDGDLDVVVPSSFFLCSFIAWQHCGGVTWYEQDGATWRSHDIVTPEAVLFYHHAEIVDFDGDGIRDVVTTGEEMAGFAGGTTRAVTEWYRGQGGGRFEETARSIGAGLGSFPRVLDVDGDGDLDVAGAEYFVDGGSFAWFERTADPSGSAPGGTFTRHAISTSHGPSVQLRFVDDLYGDGVRRAVGTNHTNTQGIPADPEESQVVVFTPGADVTAPWAAEKISTGIVSENDLLAKMAAPGIFDVGDLDADGDLDLVVEGDGDPRVFWFEQTAPGRFDQHVLLEGMRQTGGARIADLDGDGCNDIVVTAYEDDRVMVFTRD